MREGDKLCDDWKEGYALSFKKTKCIKFDGCEKLDNGNTKCKECCYHFHLEDNGICLRTLRSKYNDNNVCTRCHEGYYLNIDTN